MARRKQNVVGAIGSPRDPNLVVQLAAELHQVSGGVLSELGLDDTSREEAIALASRRKRIKVSDRVLEKIHSLSRVLGAWRQDNRYQGAGGPKTLPIRGRGPSFQSLMKEMAPGMEIEEGLQALIEQSDVRLARGNKVSMLGSTTVLYPKSPEVLLAALVTDIRRLSATRLSNALIPSGVKGDGLYDRAITVRMSLAQWEKFRRSIRSPVDDLIEHVQGQTEDRPHARDGKHNYGLTVFLWED